MLGPLGGRAGGVGVAVAGGGVEHRGDGEGDQATRGHRPGAGLENKRLENKRDKDIKKQYLASDIKKINC